MPPTAEAPLMLSVSGCRGIVGRTMTPEVAARFGGVVGAWLCERARASTPSLDMAGRPLVVLGRDGRAGGEVLARAAGAGLAGAGCDVADIGVAATPTVGVATDARHAAGAMVITASHNPQEWNGLKIMVRDERDGPVSACAPSAGVAEEIIRLFRAPGTAAGTPIPGPGGVGAVQEEVRAHGGSHAGAGGMGGAHTGGAHTGGAHMGGVHADWGPTREHVDRVKEVLAEIGFHDDRRAMAIKAVVDSVNASGRTGARLLLGQRLVHHLGAGDNGVFPHPPEPVKENLALLCRFVQERRADIGFAQDPDADRLAIVDERGEYIGEEYTLALAAEAVLGAPPGAGRTAGPPTLVTNLSTSRMLEDVAARHGARVLRTAVGEANVVEAMKREGALLGGEGNGGVIWPRVTYIRDSLSAMGLVLALMSRTGKKVSELVAAIPRYAIIKRKVELKTRADADRAIEAATRAFAKERLDRQDGVRIDFDSRRAWLHIRASNTEPIMRLIAEAPTEAEATALLDNAARIIA